MSLSVSLSNDQKKSFRTIGHKLHPIVMISDKGLTTAVLTEINRALKDHELIKIKLNIHDRQQRHVCLSDILSQCEAHLVQSVGLTALLFKPAAKRNVKLSNIVRFKVKPKLAPSA